LRDYCAKREDGKESHRRMERAKGAAMSESSSLTAPLQKAIRQMGHLCLRMNSGTMKKGKHWVKLHDAGTGDLLVFTRDGRVIWLETKKPKSEGGHTNREQVEAQEEFRIRVESFGHVYRRVTSVDEGLDAIRGA
jgi:hypothetical protein